MVTTYELKKVDSKVLAEYILEREGKMSHLKLQKLLYLVAGYHLAYFDAPLVADQFEAWVHGPVSRKLYNSLKQYSILYSDIQYKPEDGELSPRERLEQTLTSDQLDLIDEVLDLYGKDSGLQLEQLTHQQSPWLNARTHCAPGDKCEQVISNEDIRSYFKTLLA